MKNEKSAFVKFYLMLCVAITFLFVSVHFGLCDGVPVLVPSPSPSPAPVSDADFLNFFVQSIGGLKGAGALVIAGSVVQLILKLMNTPFAGGWFDKIEGKWKISIVLGLGMVGGIIALMSSGLSLSAAAVHASTLSTFMVFANQVYQQFTTKPGA